MTKVIDPNYVNLGDVARGECKEQMQYVARDIRLHPQRYEGLRITGDTADYHFMKIHKEDVAEFVRRYFGRLV